MLCKRDEISVKQLIIIIYVALIASILRVMPGAASETAAQAGWIGILLSVFPLWGIAVLVWLMYKRRGNGNSLADIVYETLGGVLGRIVVCVYIIYFLIETAVTIRFYEERFLTTTYEVKSAGFFVVAMLCIVWYAARGRLTAFARMTEIFFIIVALIILAAVIFSIPGIDALNYLPVTYYHAVPAMKVTLTSTILMGGGFFALFLSDKVNYEGIKKPRPFLIALIPCAIGALITAACIGKFGAPVVSAMESPFYMLIKGVKILDIIERFESMGIFLWIINDFVMITLLVKILAALMQSVFKLKDRKAIVTPVIFITGALSVIIAPDIMQLNALEEKVMLSAAFILEICIIPIVFIVGKLRKKL